MELKRRAYRTAKGLVGMAGFDLTRRHFYSPIPSVLPESTWTERNELRGVRWDLDQQLGWLTETVAPAVGEFVPPIVVTADYTFTYPNGSFGNGDADVLYGALRTLKPTRVVELGSGHSSVVMRLALERNAAEGHACQYRVLDPFPTDHLAGSPLAFDAATGTATTVEPLAAETLDRRVVEELEAGDVLFVDTTHTVRLGGDVVKIVLDLLPSLAPGVLVHVHDVFLPYAYPRTFFEDNEFYWAEQYMLQAFLAYNDHFEVLAGLHALFRERRSDFAAVVPSVAAGGYPGSIWMRRTDGSSVDGTMRP